MRSEQSLVIYQEINSPNSSSNPTGALVLPTESLNGSRQLPLGFDEAPVGIEHRDMGLGYGMRSLMIC